jgi:hypothetical protein
LGVLIGSRFFYRCRNDSHGISRSLWQRALFGLLHNNNRANAKYEGENSDNCNSLHLKISGKNTGSDWQKKKWFSRFSAAY